MNACAEPLCAVGGRLCSGKMTHPLRGVNVSIYIQMICLNNNPPGLKFILNSNTIYCVIKAHSTQGILCSLRQHRHTSYSTFMYIVWHSHKAEYKHPQCLYTDTQDCFGQSCKKRSFFPSIKKSWQQISTSEENSWHYRFRFRGQAVNSKLTALTVKKRRMGFIMNHLMQSEHTAR